MKKKSFWNKRTASSLFAAFAVFMTAAPSFAEYHTDNLIWSDVLPQQYLASQAADTCKNYHTSTSKKGQWRLPTWSDYQELLSNVPHYEPPYRIADYANEEEKIYKGIALTEIGARQLQHAFDRDKPAWMAANEHQLALNASYWCSTIGRSLEDAQHFYQMAFVFGVGGCVQPSSSHLGNERNLPASVFCVRDL